MRFRDTDRIKPNAGFTLIELMVVIGIIAILSSIVIPNYIGYRENQQVVRAARDVYSALQSARMTAIRDNTTIRVQFTPGSGSAGSYRVYEDLNGDGSFDAGDRNIASGQMPHGVSIPDADTNFGTGSVNSTEFDPLGLAIDRSGTVTVTNGGRTLQVSVSQGGSVSMI